MSEAAQPDTAQCGEGAPAGGEAPATRLFPLADILTVVTGRFYCADVGDLYAILGFLTGDTLFTHQLPAACAAVLGGVLDQLPQLRGATPPETSDAAAISEWLADQERQHGKALALHPVPGWGTHSPLTDLVEIITANHGTKGGEPDARAAGEPSE